MPIIVRPLAPPTSSSRRGERAIQFRAVPAATAHMLSETRAIATKMAPSSSSCSGTCPADRVGELGEHRGEEDDRLRVGYPDQETVAQHPAGARGRDAPGQDLGQ